MRRQTVRAVAVGAVLLALAACSTSTQVADKIKDQFSEQLGLSVTVSCPKEAKAEAAAKFDCTATYDGTDMNIHIVFTDATHFNFATGGFVAPAATANRDAAAYLAAKGKAVDTIDCGRAMVFAPASGTFACDGTASGLTATYTFTVDDTGAITSVEKA